MGTTETSSGAVSEDQIRHTPQALQVTQVMTDAPRRRVDVGRTRVRFFVKRGIEKTLTEPLADAFAPLRVSTPAATAFDLVRYAARVGGLGRAVETLLPLLSHIRLTELKHVLDAENETATAQRLGYIIESAGKPELAKVVRDWLPPQLALVPLTPSTGASSGAPVVERWRILDNAGQPGL